MSRTLTSEELKYLSVVVSNFRTLREDTILCGISSDGIQVLSDKFVEQATELDLPVTETKTNIGTYLWEYSFMVDGCRVFCISDKRLFQPLCF